MYTMANCLAQDRIARGKRVCVIEPTDFLIIFWLSAVGLQQSLHLVVLSTRSTLTKF